MLRFQPTKKPASWVAFVITSAFFLYEFVARVEPSLATVGITMHFELTNTELGTISGLFFWVYAPMQLVVGMLLDHYGTRRLIVPAIALCALGIVVFASTASPTIAIIGRLLTGLGASFGFIGALYIVNHSFAPERFALLSGMVNMIGMLGTAISAVVLSVVIETEGWRYAYFATGGIGALLFCIAYMFLHNEAEVQSREIRVPQRQVLRKLVTNRRLWLIAIAGSLYYMPVNVFAGLWGQNALTVDHGLSPIDAEISVSMIFWGIATGSVATGALSDWLRHRKWLIVANALLAAATYAGVILFSTGSVWFLSMLLFLSGFFGGAQMLTLAMAKDGVPAAISGTVIAFVNMIGISSAVVFQPLVGGLIDLGDGRFRAALMSIPVCLIAAAVIIAMVNEKTKNIDFDLGQDKKAQ